MLRNNITNRPRVNMDLELQRARRFLVVGVSSTALDCMLHGLQLRREPRLDLRRSASQTCRPRGLILWGGWLITCAVCFSVAGFFHQYYLAMLGAAHPVRAALLLLAAAGATLGFHVYAARMYAANTWWMAVPVALLVSYRSLKEAACPSNAGLRSLLTKAH